MKGTNMSGVLLPGRSLPLSRKTMDISTLCQSPSFIFPARFVTPPHPHSGEAHWRADPWCSLIFCHLMFEMLYQAVTGLSPFSVTLTVMASAFRNFQMPFLNRGPGLRRTGYWCPYSLSIFYSFLASQEPSPRYWGPAVVLLVTPMDFNFEQTITSEATATRKEERSLLSFLWGTQMVCTQPNMMENTVFYLVCYRCQLSWPPQEENI